MDGLRLLGLSLLLWSIEADGVDASANFAHSRVEHLGALEKLGDDADRMVDPTWAVGSGFEAGFLRLRS